MTLDAELGPKKAFLASSKIAIFGLLGELLPGPGPTPDPNEAGVDRFATFAGNGVSGTNKPC